MSDKQRVKRYNVRLTEDFSERLEIQAKKHGLPPTSFCAFALGAYVNQLEVQEASVAKMLSDPTFLAHFGKLPE